VPKYRSWQQAAGYFDGDGTIITSDISNRPYKLGLSLVFVDQSADQIANVRDFLNNHGIRTSRVLKRSDGNAYELAVSELYSVKRMLTRIAPYLCKKGIEARAALDYCLDRITGNELIAVFQAEVDAGRRERHARHVALDIPYTRLEGGRIMRQLRKDRIRDAMGRYRAKLTPVDFKNIRTKYFDEGKRVCDLTREYPGYSRESIRRILGKGRRYILVKGVGRVDTTDTTIRDAFRAHQRAEEWR